MASFDLRSKPWLARVRVRVKVRVKVRVRIRVRDWGVLAVRVA